MTGAVRFLLIAAITAGCAHAVAPRGELVCPACPATVSGGEETDDRAAAVPECPDQSTAGLSRCANKQYERSAVEMEAAFDELMATVTRQWLIILEEDIDHAEAEKARLRTAQAAWERFREANCTTALETGFDPEGTGFSIGSWDCLARMTRDRTKQLREYTRRMPLPPFH